MISTNYLIQLERYLTSKGYGVFPNGLNIVALEGSNPDGTLNTDSPDKFNDLLIVWDYLEGKPRLRGSYVCTTEPGKYYTDYPLNPKGAARIKMGQYRAWRIGYHQGNRNHEALVQVAPVTVLRDKNKDSLRTGDAEDTGLFGINIHHGWDTAPGGSIGRHSAGCTVIPSRAQLRHFLSVLKSSSAYKVNPNYIWTITFVDASDFKKWRETKLS